MSDTVIVVPGTEPEPVVEVAAPDAGGAGVAAGVALATAEGAEATATEALVTSEAALVTAETALNVAEVRAIVCCEHCEEHGMRLASLEEGRAVELEQALAVEEEPELDVPAPGPKPKKRAAPEKDSKPPRKSLWPM